MDIIIAKHVNRIRFFEENTSDNYTQWILKVWHGESVEQPNEDDKRCITYKTIVDKKREHYFTLTKGGIKRWITWKINQYKQSEKLYKKFMELTTYKPDK